MKKAPRRQTSISKDEARLFREAVSGVEPFSQQPRVNSRPAATKKRAKPFSGASQDAIISEDGESFRRVNIDPATFSALKAENLTPKTYSISTAIQLTKQCSDLRILLIKNKSSPNLSVSDHWKRIPLSRRFLACQKFDPRADANTSSSRRLLLGNPFSWW